MWKERDTGANYNKKMERFGRQLHDTNNMQKKRGDDADFSRKARRLKDSFRRRSTVGRTETIGAVHRNTMSFLLERQIDVAHSIGRR